MPILQADALLALFCSLDDFCQTALPALEAQSLPIKGKRHRKRSLAQSEIMTLLVAFQQSSFRCFKAFYLGFVCRYWKSDFPTLVSYNRFIEFVPSVVTLLHTYLKSLLGRSRGICFVDSTALAVCHNKRISQHRVFKNTAKRGRTSVQWFFGFKLHLVINEQGQLISFFCTAGNVHDTQPVPQLLAGVTGKVFADKGYLSEPLRKQLADQGIALVTKVRKNMKAVALTDFDTFLLGKRPLIESVIDHLKNTQQVEHTRHRSTTGFMTNLLCALVAYCRQTKKPSLNLRITLPATSA